MNDHPGILLSDKIKSRVRLRTDKMTELLSFSDSECILRTQRHFETAHFAVLEVIGIGSDSNEETWPVAHGGRRASPQMGSDPDKSRLGRHLPKRSLTLTTTIFPKWQAMLSNRKTW